MANVTYADLPAATTPLGGTEIVSLMQGGVTSQCTAQDVADLASAGGSPDLSLSNGRLTLTSGVPVTTTDVTAAATLYWALYKGNRITLYDGADWVEFALTQQSIAVPATTNTMYDVFMDYNSGTPQLALTAWTNDTTRATALTTQDGVYVKTGALTQRYLGSFRTTGSSGQTEDSLAKRYVWNYYNRVLRPMKVTDPANSWPWSTASFHQANANAANQLDFVVGIAEDMIHVHATGQASTSTATSRITFTGIGINSTSVNSASVMNLATSTNVTSFPSFAIYEGVPVVGRTYMPWLEYGGGADVQTWLGDDNNPSRTQTGILGSLFG